MNRMKQCSIKLSMWILMVFCLLLLTPLKILAQELMVIEEKILVDEAEKEYLTVDDAIVELRNQMARRTEDVVLCVITDEYQPETFFYDILMQALEHTGSPIEGDYIRFHTSQVTVQQTCENENGMNYVTLKYTISYFSTAEQESELDEKFEEVMEKLKLSKCTEYQKVKIIYDYITGNIAYDYVNKGNEEYMLKESAYAALINKSCVCQGYANLFYRMALSAGVDCRIIEGMSYGEGHAWNIVRIDGKYYNVDCTWDAERIQTGYSYYWFLKSDKEFINHTRNNAYLDAGFTEKYPIAECDYGKEKYWTSHVAKEFSAGDGTENSPYQISTAEELALMAYRINSDDSYAMFAHYQLVNNIDLYGYEWIPILDFYGTLDGQGYAISNMYIRYMGDGEAICYGLIGYAERAVLKNLNIVESVIDVTECDNTDEGFFCYTIGLLGGECLESEITNCTVEGEITYNVALYGANVGGLLGYAARNTKIDKSYANVNLYVSSEGSTSVGGLLGHAESAEINQSSCIVNIDLYAINGDPNEECGWQATVGGLIGISLWYPVTINNCYAFVDADAEATKTICIGGTIGCMKSAIELNNVYVVSEIRAKCASGSTVFKGLFGAPINNSDGGYLSLPSTILKDCGYFDKSNFIVYNTVGKNADTLLVTNEYSNESISSLFTKHMSYDTVVWDIENGYYPVHWGQIRKEMPGTPHVHTIESISGKAATCVEDGLTDGAYCRGCGEILQEQKVLYLTGQHVYDNDEDDTCEICGYTRDLMLITTPMYRLYNPNSGEHFYTGSVKERDDLYNVGWKYEGIAWNAPISTGMPVYRMYNPNSSDHHYTMSLDEVNMLVEAGWIYENVCWNSASAYNLPLYRLYNPNADCGSHHYTGSEQERDMLIGIGWIYEGIGWFGLLK